MHDRELQHYGVKGMKWGVRRMTYKTKGYDSLKKSRAKIEKDNDSIQRKSDRLHDKSARLELRGARRARSLLLSKDSRLGKIRRFLGTMDNVEAGKLKVKARKGEKLIRRNERLLELYDMRMSDLESRTT